MKIAFQHRSLCYLLCLSLIFIGCASTFTPGPGLVSSGIHFHLLYPEAKTVAIAGSFNNWDPTTHFLDKNSADSWSIILPLSKGRYQYLFVMDKKRGSLTLGQKCLLTTVLDKKIHSLSYNKNVTFFEFICIINRCAITLCLIE